MSHNIMLNDRFFAARGGPGWHQLGTVAAPGEHLTVADSVQRAKMDFQYRSVPIGYTLPNGTFVHSGDKQMILREPTDGDAEWAEMGVVGDGYTYLQNLDIARGLDALCQITGWQAETVGALGKGETCFFTLKTGSRSIFGDQHESYLIASDGKATGRALQLAQADVRVVCQNTLDLSDRAAAHKVIIPHDAHVAGEYGFWLDIIGGLQQSQDEAYARLEALAAVKITDKQAKAIFARAYPLPQKCQRHQMAEAVLAMDGLTATGRDAAMAKLERPDKHFDWGTKAATERREAAFVLYQRFNAGEEEGLKQGRTVDPATIKQLANTPYGAVQAVAELVDWGGRNGKGSAFSAIFGEGAQAKRRALVAAAAVLK